MSTANYITVTSIGTTGDTICTRCHQSIIGSYVWGAIGPLCHGCAPPFGQTYAPIQAPTLMGWECPRCHTIHAPISLRCFCVPPHVVEEETTDGSAG